MESKEPLSYRHPALLAGRTDAFGKNPNSSQDTLIDAKPWRSPRAAGDAPCVFSSKG